MNEETTLDYMDDFKAFEANFKLTEVAPEEVGVLIMHMTGYFIRYNCRFGEALRNFSAKKAEFQNQVDTATGKAMSTSKAEILSEATIEANVYQMAKIHIINLEQIINSMKSLQKSLLTEYSNAG